MTWHYPNDQRFDLPGFDLIWFYFVLFVLFKYFEPAQLIHNKFEN